MYMNEQNFYTESVNLNISLYLDWKNYAPQKFCLSSINDNVV